VNLRLDLAYDGSPFRGFARQPDVRTVQGDLEAALGKLFGADPRTVGAGRTDAGVHALGQALSVFDAPDDTDLRKVRDALNAMLAPSISIWRVSEAHPDFHARFSARSRTYVYGILNHDVPDPFIAATTWFHPEPLDVDAMAEAAGHLVGPHDFSSFGRVPEASDPANPPSAERVLYELGVTRNGAVIRIKARANAFIQQMVRSLVGTLVQVGEGRKEPSDMMGILAAKDRAAAGPVAPPQGLCLVSVEYDEGWSYPLNPSDQGFPA
jgi:tRNA pseudouridine38-40 synthase